MCEKARIRIQIGTNFRIHIWVYNRDLTKHSILQLNEKGSCKSKSKSVTFVRIFLISYKILSVGKKWLRLNFIIHKEIISRQSFEILAFRICENTVVAESLQRTAAVV